jgi:hypothetical protein
MIEKFQDLSPLFDQIVERIGDRIPSPECSLPACLHENAAVNNPPAENQLGKIPCGYVVPLSEE